MKKSRLTRLLSVFLVLLLLCASLVSCESKPIKPGKNAIASVGTVGEFDVPYEELYFLVNSYKKQLDVKYSLDATSERTEEYKKELRELVYDNIVSNYAVLTLCKDVGLSPDTADIEEQVQAKIDSYIKSDFDGKRREYKNYLKETGVTDNYLRFSIEVDLLYSKLTSEYLKRGIINDDEAFIRSTINDEFVRTWHIMIIDDGTEASKSKAEEALAKINSGVGMYEMIGSKYNQDFQLTVTDGYYFTKGEMEGRYEAAAYDLEVGEISGLVKSTGKNSSGDSVECYYIIQRLALEDEYINKNFDTLKDKYYTSVVIQKVDSVTDALEFKPNDYCNSLDLLKLEAPRQTDVALILVISISVVSVLAVAGVIVLVVYKKKSRAKRYAPNNKLK